MKPREFIKIFGPPPNGAIIEMNKDCPWRGRLANRILVSNRMTGDPAQACNGWHRENRISVHQGSAGLSLTHGRAQDEAPLSHELEVPGPGCSEMFRIPPVVVLEQITHTAFEVAAQVQKIISELTGLNHPRRENPFLGRREQGKPSR